MSASGYWRITLYINNGTTGVGESHVLSAVGQTPGYVQKKALELARFRSDLLGNNNTGGIATSVKALASPQIEFIRIADALNPRNAYTFRVTDPKSSFGFAGISTNGAEELHRAFGIRLPGATTAGTGRSSFANNLLVGMPDAGIVNGQYVGSLALGTGPSTRRFRAI